MTLPLDVPTAINQRRSIMLKTLVELTVAAPSSFNIQDWRIILVQDEAQKAALAEAAWGQKQIIQAPVTFVFAADAAAGGGDLTPIYEQALSTGAWNEGTVKYFQQAIPGFHQDLGEKTREYAIKDAMIAATHLVLAAESLGLSSCFLNGWIEDKVKAVAAEPRLNPGRLPLDYNVFVDRLGNPYQI